MTTAAFACPLPMVPMEGPGELRARADPVAQLGPVRLGWGVMAEVATLRFRG